MGAEAPPSAIRLFVCSQSITVPAICSRSACHSLCDMIQHGDTVARRETGARLLRGDLALLRLRLVSAASSGRTVGRLSQRPFDRHLSPCTSAVTPRQGDGEQEPETHPHGKRSTFLFFFFFFFPSSPRAELPLLQGRMSATKRGGGELQAINYPRFRAADDHGRRAATAGSSTRLRHAQFPHVQQRWPITARLASRANQRSSLGELGHAGFGTRGGFVRIGATARGRIFP
ncbi:hypothetical protein FN846DRAFT_280533 [Sphaerosporella brunnea]|uniref:Uncharacterized protein n=1 Tax=Sphaerosporella brunnea TaxID=1250544 RepID=A0A5J5ENE3_9PEZI|nr:hypothetical protein FN846DRAFT_280533 [Sphaerosporella brunnea]